MGEFPVKEAQLLIGLLQAGGSAGLAGVCLAAWWFERKENRSLQKTVIDLVTLQVSAAAKNDASIKDLSNLLGQILQRLMR